MVEQTIKKKYFFKIFAIFLLFMMNNSNLPYGISNNEIVNFEEIDFRPDTTINNKLVLNNSNSLEKFYTRDFVLIPESQRLPFPAVFFSNRTRTQYLAAYRYYGSSNDQFSLFEVGYCDESITGISLIQTEYHFFETESNIMLGTTKEAVIQKKGSNFFTVIDGDITIIRYVLKNRSSKFLKRYKMPGYYMEYWFNKHDLLVKYSFGFEYP